MRLTNDEVSTFMMDGIPGLLVKDSVTAPACFWIDHKHVYLRTTWSQWNPVSLDEPAHVVALCNAPYCQLVVCEKRHRFPLGKFCD